MGGVYIDYEIYKSRYYETQRALNDILTEKEKIFTRTLPNAIHYDNQVVGGGLPHNNFDEYMAELEENKVNERLAEAKQLLFERQKLLYLKEQELRASKNKVDVVYRMRFLDDIKPSTIATALAYSESQIYRILEQIKKRR